MFSRGGQQNSLVLICALLLILSGSLASEARAEIGVNLDFNDFDCPDYNSFDFDTDLALDWGNVGNVNIDSKYKDYNFSLDWKLNPPTLDINSFEPPYCDVIKVEPPLDVSTFKPTEPLSTKVNLPYAGFQKNPVDITFSAPSVPKDYKEPALDMQQTIPPAAKEKSAKLDKMQEVAEPVINLKEGFIDPERINARYLHAEQDAFSGYCQQGQNNPQKDGFLAELITIGTSPVKAEGLEDKLAAKMSNWPLRPYLGEKDPEVVEIIRAGLVDDLKYPDDRKSIELITDFYYNTGLDTVVCGENKLDVAKQVKKTVFENIEYIEEYTEEIIDLYKQFHKARLKGGKPRLNCLGDVQLTHVFTLPSGVELGSNALVELIELEDSLLKISSGHIANFFPGDSIYILDRDGESGLSGFLSERLAKDIAAHHPVLTISCNDGTFMEFFSKGSDGLLKGKLTWEGFFELVSGDVRLGLTKTREALRINPKDPFLKFIVGNVYSEYFGDLVKAKDVFKAASQTPYYLEYFSKLQPKSQYMQLIISEGYSEEAQNCIHNGDYTEAEGYIEQAKEHLGQYKQMTSDTPEFHPDGYPKAASVLEQAEENLYMQEFLSGYGMDDATLLERFPLPDNISQFYAPRHIPGAYR